jgi:hypothetical protein
VLSLDSDSLDELDSDDDASTAVVVSDDELSVVPPLELDSVDVVGSTCPDEDEDEPAFVGSAVPLSSPHATTATLPTIHITTLRISIIQPM